MGDDLAKTVASWISSGRKTVIHHSAPGAPHRHDFAIFHVTHTVFEPRGSEDDVCIARVSTWNPDACYTVIADTLAEVSAKVAELYERHRATAELRGFPVINSEI